MFTTISGFFDKKLLKALILLTSAVFLNGRQSLPWVLITSFSLRFIVACSILGSQKFENIFKILAIEKSLTTPALVDSVIKNILAFPRILTHWNTYQTLNETTELKLLCRMQPTLPPRQPKMPYLWPLDKLEVVVEVPSRRESTYVAYTIVFTFKIKCSVVFRPVKANLMYCTNNNNES